MNTSLDFLFWLIYEICTCKFKTTLQRMHNKIHQVIKKYVNKYKHIETMELMPKTQVKLMFLFLTQTHGKTPGLNVLWSLKTINMKIMLFVQITLGSHNQIHVCANVLEHIIDQFYRMCNETIYTAL